MNKYNARSATRDGITFDSQAEARRYDQLLLLERAGEITELVVHQRFEIFPGFIRDGKKIQAIYYEVDYAYLECASGKWVAEDVKGIRTAVFKIKIKMFLYRYKDIDFRIVEA
jgi:Protein of unknown function (DUF1064)